MRHLDATEIEDLYDLFPGAQQFNRVEFSFVELALVLSELRAADGTLQITVPMPLADQYVCCVEDTRTNAYIGENYLHAESRRKEGGSLHPERVYFWPCIDSAIVYC